MEHESRHADASDSIVRTVTGDVAPGSLGHTQTHEHLLCDLGAMLPPTADEEERSRRDQPITLANYYATRRNHDLNDDLRLDSIDLATGEMTAYLQHGGGTVVEATSRGLGRDPHGLLAIAQAAGVNVVMGAAYYVHQFHPPTVATMSSDEIANEIVEDVTVGVDGTSIRAGIIGEVGMTWPAHPDELKVLSGAVKAQQTTGAALLIHPGRDVASIFDALDRIENEGGDLQRTIISHIDRTIADPSITASIAQRGAFVELDLFGQETSHYAYSDFEVPNDAGRLAHITAVCEQGHLDRVLISQDICYKTKTTAYGGEGYTHILRHVLPKMRARGFTDAEIRSITVDNPAQVLPLDRRARTH